MSDRISRRVFLAGSLALSSCRKITSAPSWTGGIVGASHEVGHLLRKGKEGSSALAEPADVIVVGGGIAGLIAALRLKQAGRSVRVIELESEVGGNSVSGKNATSSYPWGAHYVPVPAEEMTDVCNLLTELGLGRPGAWDSDQICHDPNERLWFRGRWQEGIVPSYGLSAEAKREIDRFFECMEFYKTYRGKDHRRAFAIPVDESSRDPELLDLDTITMAEWMVREKWLCPELKWHVNYCCRDDYGAGIETVSAWAGIHYFASRSSADVFTWPEGNGWIVAKLRERLLGDLVTGNLVTRITPEGRVEMINAKNQGLHAWQANAIVCAAPRFIAKHLIPGLEAAPAPSYSPWMVANLTIRESISHTWDNVLHHGRSLGYTVATHQNFYPALGPTVITYYQPLDHLPPAEARKEALAKSYPDWCRRILNELEGPHPDIREKLTHLDVMLWGHAMVRPLPGVIHGSQRVAMSQPMGKIHFAHSDMSGISIFEEACHWGNHAARSILS
jgi:hypothetical protein